MDLFGSSKKEKEDVDTSFCQMLKDAIKNEKDTQDMYEKIRTLAKDVKDCPILDSNIVSIIKDKKKNEVMVEDIKKKFCD
jgi:hypothetical protein